MRWLALATVALFLAVACGGPNSSSASTTVNFWYLSSGTQPDQAFQQAVKAFEAKHPETTVKGTPITPADAYTRLLAATTSGTGPDAIQINASWTGALTAS